MVQCKQRAAQVQRSVIMHVEEILGMGLYMYMYNTSLPKSCIIYVIMYVFLYDIFLCFHEMC